MSKWIDPCTDCRLIETIECGGETPEDERCPIKDAARIVSLEAEIASVRTEHVAALAELTRSHTVVELEAQAEIERLVAALLAERGEMISLARELVTICGKAITERDGCSRVELLLALVGSTLTTEYERAEAAEAALEAVRGRAERMARVMGCAPDAIEKVVGMFADDAINETKRADAALARAETAERGSDCAHEVGRRLWKELDRVRSEMEMRITAADTVRDAALAREEFWKREWRKSEDNMMSIANGTACGTCVYRGISESIAPTLNQMQGHLAAARADAVREFAEWAERDEVIVEDETHVEAAARFLARKEPVK